MALQSVANPHVLAEVFEFLADPGDAAACRALRNACRLAATGYDVAVHTGGVAVAGHRIDAADDAGASYRWAGGWFPVAIPAWPAGEGDGCTRAFVHTQGAPVCVRVEVRMLRESHLGGLADNELAWDATSVAFVETRASATNATTATVAMGTGGRRGLSPCCLDATVVRALGSAVGGLDFKLQPTTTALGPYGFGFPELRLPEVWDFSGLEHVASFAEVSVGCLYGVRTLSTAGLAGLTELSHSFVYSSPSLTALDMSGCKKLRSIGNRFVCSNVELNEVNLSSFGTVESIGSNFMSGNSRLRAVELPPMPLMQRVEDGWMTGSGLRHFDAAGLSEVRSIGANFFNSCPRLESIALRGMTKLAVIEARALAGCVALKSIDMGELCELRKIGPLFACSAEALTQVDTSGLTGVQEIGEFFLGQCPALRHVDLTAFRAVTSIGRCFMDQVKRGPALKQQLSDCPKIVRKALPAHATMPSDADGLNDEAPDGDIDDVD